MILKMIIKYKEIGDTIFINNHFVEYTEKIKKNILRIEKIKRIL